ncbi:hypothetical protein [Nocardioides sp.]|uniref:hypothetical protein n=1 Tax=Nocardioides sp. TaxID=35761 RepID=UPI003512D1ED
MRTPPKPAGHDEVPADPANGEVHRCSRCGHTAEFVVLDDGLPGEWVDTTPSEDR